MKRGRAAAALLATGFLVVSGCSSNADAGAPAAPPSPSASIDCDNPDITVGEWQENCLSDEEESVEPAEGDETPLDAPPYTPVGKPIEFTKRYNDGSGTTWSVKLSKIECGLNSLPATDPNPDWQGEDDVPEYITAKAPKGSDFCVLYWDWKNIGKRPDHTVQSGDLMFGDQRFARDSDDETRSEHFMENNLGIELGDDTNPRKSTKSADIYTIDEGTVPDAVWFPSETMVDESYVLMATK